MEKKIRFWQHTSAYFNKYTLIIVFHKCTYRNLENIFYHDTKQCATFLPYSKIIPNRKKKVNDTIIGNLNSEF